MRIATLLFGLLMLAAAGPSATRAQETTQPQESYFSGVITALSADKITVNRVVLGNESATKTFAITAETKVEGKPKVNARVTVRFAAGEDGEKALQIIVRTGGKKD